MMIKNVLLFLFLSIGYFGSLAAQCYPAGVTFSSQADVNAFHSNNPTCTTIEGDLIISGDDITNLDSLKYITNFAGALKIEENPNLANLNGLDNVVSIAGDLKIKINNNLVDIEALSNLVSVGYNIEVILNPKLINLTGLDQIQTIESTLIIGDNLLLTSLAGLQNIKSVKRSAWIGLNPQLSDISALSQLASIGDSLQLKNLPSLNSIQSLSNLTTVGGKITLRDLAVSDFSGLESLQSIDTLVIWSNKNLTSLAGLSNLNKVNGFLSILFNDELTNLLGLDNLETINGYLEINYNNKLTSLVGLDKLTKTNGFLSIMSNAVLTDLTSLTALDSILGDFLLISDNQSLESLKGIDNLKYIGGSSVSIHDNPNLSNCGISSLCYFIEYSDYVDIYNNAPGCDKISDVENTCGAAIIEGFVFSDLNSNCSFDPGEFPLPNWPIIAVQGADTLFAFTNQAGIYKIFAQAGTYQVKTIPPTYWTETCSGTQEVVLLSASSKENVNFFGSEDIPCPSLQIDLSSTRAEACNNTIYHVNYCNQGTNEAAETHVDISFSEDVVVDSASISYADIGDNQFQFDLGTTPIGFCGDFIVYAHIDCAVIPGQVVCAFAKIFPNEICTPSDPNWSQASLKITSECTDSIRFKIENIGEGTAPPSVYDLIIEDWVLLRGEKQMPAGDIITFTYPKDGKTHTLRVDQVPFHPGRSNPLVTVEGCTDQTTFSTGYTLQFPEDDADYFVSANCQEIGAMAQVNFPKGYSDKHYIERGQDIEYKTSFQNMQDDTLQNIVLKEVISPYLDLTTLKIGASSHPYTYKVIEDTLIIHFRLMNLPHSATSPVTSQGFIKYRISQKPNLPNGTIIHNKAMIYFGANPSVETNSVFNTIEENFVLVEVLDPNNNLKVTASPNPFTDHTVLSFEGIDFANAQFSLYDSAGKLLRSESFTGHSYDLLRRNLPAGTYPFQFIIENRIITTGQVTIY